MAEKGIGRVPPMSVPISGAIQKVEVNESVPCADRCGTDIQKKAIASRADMKDFLTISQK